MKSVLSLAEKHIPKMVLLIGKDQEFWDQLQLKFELRISTAEVDQLAENSIPRLIGSAETGNLVASEFLAFIDDSTWRVYNALSDELKNIFVLSVKKLCLEFRKKDEEYPTPSYLNWISELLVLEKFLFSPDHRIINFETKMENGKCADLEVLDSSNSTILIDVVNIHLKAKHRKGIFREINRKLKEKINSKFGGMSMKGKYLLPVIWFDMNLSNFVLDAIKNLDLASMNIIPPCTLFYTPEDIRKSYLSTIEKFTKTINTP